MAEPTMLDRAFHYVLETFAERGTAPHYTELARHFGEPPEAGRSLLHELMGSGIPAWLHPDTELIASFAPFNNVPTHYRILVEGEPRGYAQCGFEAMAITWVFPGRKVTIEAPCLDCGEPLRIAMRDGEVLESDPPGIYGFVDVPAGQWVGNLPYA